MGNFNKENFSKILVEIKNTYDSLNQMAEKSGVTAAYLSKLIRLMYDNPPSLDIIKKIADNSNGVANYEDLMYICGYLDESLYKGIQSIKYLDKHMVPENVHMNFSIALKSLDSKDLINFIEKNSNILSHEQIKSMLTLQEAAIEVALNDKKIVDKKEKQEAQLMLNNIKLVRKLYKLDIDSNIFPSPESNLYMCPVYGRIAAGTPNWAEQCMEGRLPLDPDMMNIHNPEECFFLRVSGESMNKLVKNGGYALIRKQDTVENGEVAVVLVNGYDATLKKFTQKNDVVVLEPMSDDESIETQIYDKNTEIKILGKYIGKFEMNSK